MSIVSRSDVYVLNMCYWPWTSRQKNCFSGLSKLGRFHTRMFM